MGGEEAIARAVESGKRPEVKAESEREDKRRLYGHFHRERNDSTSYRKDRAKSGRSISVTNPRRIV